MAPVSKRERERRAAAGAPVATTSSSGPSSSGPSSTGPAQAQDASSPFAKLAALRDALPAGAAEDAPRPAVDARREGDGEGPRRFGDKVVVRKERKGHGGKTVTVVAGVAPAFVDALCAEMKKALGCGARVDDGAVVLQGDLVDRAAAFLEDSGARRVVRGSR